MKKMKHLKESKIKQDLKKRMLWYIKTKNHKQDTYQQDLRNKMFKSVHNNNNNKM